MIVRDEKSNALINTDNASYNKYKIERERIKNMDRLAEEVKDIKKVLSLICEKIDKIESR